MISRHGREFASNAELRRYEANNPQMPRVLNGCMCQMGECESCNRVVRAFLAMRDALPIALDYIPKDGENERDDRESIECAIALADKVTR